MNKASFAGLGLTAGCGAFRRRPVAVRARRRSVHADFVAVAPVRRPARRPVEGILAMAMTMAPQPTICRAWDDLAAAVAAADDGDSDSSGGSVGRCRTLSTRRPRSSSSPMLQIVEEVPWRRRRSSRTPKRSSEVAAAAASTATMKKKTPSSPPLRHGLAAFCFFRPVAGRGQASTATSQLHRRRRFTLTTSTSRVRVSSSVIGAGNVGVAMVRTSTTGLGDLRATCGTTTPGPSYDRAACRAVKANETCSFTESEKIWALIHRQWRTTYRLDRTQFGKPIGPITRQRSLGGCLGLPMEQRVPDTCALVSCVVCVEAAYRLQHEALHGKGAFKYRALAPEVWLLNDCRLHGIWALGEGAYVGDVLDKIQQMGGVPVTSGGCRIGSMEWLISSFAAISSLFPFLYPFFVHILSMFSIKVSTIPPAPTLHVDPNEPAPAEYMRLPLRSWKEYVCDGSDGGVTPETVAALLDRGPCVGLLWACPWYGYFDAAREGGTTLVYRGCGSSQDDRIESEELYGGRRCPAGFGWHAVVCVDYRLCGDEKEMHVLVLDNHDKTGPLRWVHVEEIDTLYTLTV